MIDEISEENPPELLNYPSMATEINSWKGSGKLIWRSKSYIGTFMLTRLLNGRLRFVFKPDNWRNTDGFFRSHNLEFDGVAEDESLISVKGIHFIRRSAEEMPWDIFVGFAQNASRQVEADTDIVSIRCDLTNYSLNRRLSNVKFQLDGFVISIERLGWGRDANNIEDHAAAYQHAPLSTCLKIENIPVERISEAIDCLQGIATLLSIACRGQVFIVAQYIFNKEMGKLDSLFEAPPFLNRKWGRSLIPSDVIEEFILATYPINGDRVKRLAFAYVSDHYLWALASQSAWPFSVGIFTAMDSLREAFFNQYKSQENESYRYWAVPGTRNQFNKKSKIATEEILQVLGEHFPIPFSQLTDDDKNELKAQIKGSFTRRGYRTQLERMLSQFNIEYTSDELDFFIKTRNLLIHQGTPVPADTPLDKYYAETSAAWNKVKKATSLFERALLSFLNYDGSCELFGKGFFDDNVR